MSDDGLYSWDSPGRLETAQMDEFSVSEQVTVALFRLPGGGLGKLISHEHLTNELTVAIHLQPFDHLYFYHLYFYHLYCDTVFIIRASFEGIR